MKRFVNSNSGRIWENRTGNEGQPDLEPNIETEKNTYWQKQTLLIYPHKGDKGETITRDSQTSYEHLICRINEEFNMFNNNETKVHIPLHRTCRVRHAMRGAGRYQYYKLLGGLHPGDDLKKDWVENIPR